MVKKGQPEKLIVKGKRLDGRGFDQMRDVSIKAGVIPEAEGSAELSLGETKVIAAVYGPREVIPKHLANPEKGIIKCVYTMASFATPDRNRPGPSRRSVEISKVMAEALTPVVNLEKYPKTSIDVFVEVTNANAGTRTAAINAASVALADAGIEMNDLVTSIAGGKADGQLILDLFNPEDNYGEADLPIAYLPRTGEVSLLQMDGELTPAEIEKLLKMIKKACEELYKKQKNALRERYKLK
ncbi:MAG: exosome complex exonuclease Rrp41 [Candidatus Woesearchaeota archaeon]|nr:MAG: exosome complex exonuclease Rrp41 [Candidatus Woesearchaeota archaeon]